MVREEALESACSLVRRCWQREAGQAIDLAAQHAPPRRRSAGQENEQSPKATSKLLCSSYSSTCLALDLGPGRRALLGAEVVRRTEYVYDIEIAQK